MRNEISSDAEFLVGGLGIPTDAFVRITSVDSLTVDAGSTPTTVLRRGLLMREATAGVDTLWENGSIVTSELLGFLWTPLNMLDPNGVVEDKHQVMILRSGTIDESKLPEGALAGGDKTQLESQGFVFV
jgi:hypothetical protein